MTLLAVLIGAVLFAGIAMTIAEGLWSNTISLFTIMIAGVTAISFGVPLGTLAHEQIGSEAFKMWYAVFAGIWLTFIITLIVLRILTDRLSVTRMRFIPLIDKIAGPLMGIFVATMLMSFTAFVFWRVTIEADPEGWGKADASDNQLNIFSYAQAPFYNVAKAFLDAEGESSPLMSK